MPRSKVQYVKTLTELVELLSRQYRGSCVMDYHKVIIEPSFFRKGEYMIRMIKLRRKVEPDG